MKRRCWRTPPWSPATPRCICRTAGLISGWAPSRRWPTPRWPPRKPVSEARAGLFPSARIWAAASAGGPSGMSCATPFASPRRAISRCRCSCSGRANRTCMPTAIGRNRPSGSKARSRPTAAGGDSISRAHAARSSNPPAVHGDTASTTPRVEGIGPSVPYNKVPNWYTGSESRIPMCRSPIGGQWAVRKIASIWKASLMSWRMPRARIRWNSAAASPTGPIPFRC